MSLKLTRREDSSSWWIAGSVAGRRIRESTRTSNKAFAEEYRAQREAQIFREQIYGTRAVATWSTAVISYAQVVHPSPGTARLLLRLTNHFGCVKLNRIDQLAMDLTVRALCQSDAAPATVLRNVIAPALAVLNHAHRRGWCDAPAFEKPRGASGVKRTRWLSPTEYDALCAAMPLHLRPLVVFLTCTGARLGEAISLDWRDVNLDAGTALLRKTKNGQDRLVHLLPAAIAALSEITYIRRPATAPNLLQYKQPHVDYFHEEDGAVFRTNHGVAYADKGGQGGGHVKKGWSSGRRRAGLGLDVTPHTLRHTWASWSYALNPDPFRLQENGGWASPVMVRRYTKLVPPAMVPAIQAAFGPMPAAHTASASSEVAPTS
jgi:integrase